ncbi:MAG: YjfB family protein [Lachnospiraceae bacterium]|nr:YjfB family protein [Lachnospiraceae bacterium]
MDIAALSTSMSMSSLATDIGVALCEMALDDMEVNAEGLRKIMEQSVNPYVGQNFDVTV